MIYVFNTYRLKKIVLEDLQLITESFFNWEFDREFEEIFETVAEK